MNWQFVGAIVFSILGIFLIVWLGRKFINVLISKIKVEQHGEVQ